MTDHHAFLQAILANPDEDAPRLIYADWLEEQGDGDRAEFIRVQCELAQLPARDPRRRALVHREIDLLFQHYPRWRDGLPSVSPHLVWRHFERGCMANLQVNYARAFCFHASRLFAAAPVQTLTLYDFGDEQAGTLAQHPDLSRIRQLTVRSLNVTWRGLQHLAESPQVTSLTGLDVQSTRLDATALGIIANARRLAGLRRLRLSSPSPRGLRALAQSPCLHQLTELALIGFQIDPASERLLLESPIFGRLQLLDLHGASHYDRDWSTLFKHFGDALLL